jgi:hypothetical protein
LNDAITLLDVHPCQSLRHLAGTVLQLAPRQFVEFSADRIEKRRAVRIHGGAVAE